MSIEWIPDWAPDVTFIDQTVEGSENANLSVQKYYLMDFQNQEITNLGDLEIDGESPAFGGKELNHLGPQCTDVNQDGYDDIVMGYFWWNDYRYDYPDDREGLVWETNKQIKVLINQQDGTFSTLDIPSLEDLRIKQIQTGFKAGSITGDYNGDGILDVVTYYSSVGNYLGPNSLEMNFYKGTAKILEAQ
jgi:hypothetical protein